MLASDENMILGTALDTAIAVCFDDEFLVKYASDNAAVLAATIGKAGLSWRGPMLAYCEQWAITRSPESAIWT